MSAFGQAGFGSRNRRNQLRSQGQMDPYGQQVRAAKQAPTFSVYQTQGTQQATGQQRAPSQSQPAQQPAAAQPSLQLGAPAMPAYSQPAAPIAGSAQGGPGTAQPIQPQSQGTPYGADPGYADRVAAAEQQWSSTPAGSQKIDWEGNSVRRGLAEGYSLDMITRGLKRRGRFAADPEGAAKFANQVEQDWIASLSSGLPQKPGPNATAAEHSAYLNASNAYGRQQKAQQARDERIAAEAAFNDSARTAGEPSQRWIDETRRRVIDWGEVPFGMHPFAFRQNLIAGKIDISGRPVTEETPAWARYDYQRPQSAPAAIQTIGNTPGQAQPIQPQSQGTPYQPPAAQASLEDRYRAIGMDPQVVQAQRNAGNTDQEMAQRLEALEAQYADGADARDRWALEASRRGVDPLAGAPLANRSAEQAAYHSAAYAPPDTSLPPQDEGILAYLRQRDAPKPTAQPSQQLYRTAMNAGVPDQALAFEQDAFRNMAQKAVDREAFHGANDPYVQQFLNRMQYQGFDPRQGLSVSQHIQDAQAMRQRHAAIRANPTAYQRGEI